MKSVLFMRLGWLLSLMMAGTDCASGAGSDAASTESDELPHRSLEVFLEDGKLTVNSDRASLKSILEELARQARLKVQVPDDLEQRPVSISP